MLSNWPMKGRESGAPPPSKTKNKKLEGICVPKVGRVPFGIKQENERKEEPWTCGISPLITDR